MEANKSGTSHHLPPPPPPEVLAIYKPTTLRVQTCNQAQDAVHQLKLARQWGDTLKDTIKEMKEGSVDNLSKNLGRVAAQLYNVQEAIDDSITCLKTLGILVAYNGVSFDATIQQRRNAYGVVDPRLRPIELLPIVIPGVPPPPGKSIMQMTANGSHLENNRQNLRIVWDAMQRAGKRSRSIFEDSDTEDSDEESDGDDVDDRATVPIKQESI